MLIEICDNVATDHTGLYAEQVSLLFFFHTTGVEMVRVICIALSIGLFGVNDLLMTVTNSLGFAIVLAMHMHLCC